MPIRTTIENMQQHAFERGGKCLSKEYWDDISRLMWMCAKGHVWESPWRVINRGAWCPACVKNKSKEERIESLRAIAAKRGGICLSKEYINSTTKLEWQCSKGHIWKTTPGNIVQNCWCPICGYETVSEKQKNDIEEYRKIALEKGGKLLSEKYINSRTKLLWECSKGHQWYATAGAVKNTKCWCPRCSGTQHGNIKEMHELAVRRGGKCLSEVYINSKSKLEWQCSKGHVWKATPNNIIRKRWCRICSNENTHKKQTDDIEKYQKIADERGGKLLSEKYINSHANLLWECKKGHQWEAKPYIINNAKSWCPYCAGQRITLKDMQELAIKKGGKCLSKEYKNTKTKLEWQCSKGHIWKSIPGVNIEKHWCSICAYETNAEKRKNNIETFRKIAIEREGKLLSDEYINSKTQLLWECEKGHQWKAKPYTVKSNKTWCPQCYKDKRKI